MTLLTLKKNSCHSAKVSAQKHVLYSSEELGKLIEMSFDEIMKYMQEHQYSASIDATYTTYEGFYLIEKLLNDHASRVYDKVIAAAPRKNRSFLQLYYMKYQMHNFMVFVRCKLAKTQDFEAYLIGEQRKKTKFVKAYQMDFTDGLSYLCAKLGLEITEVQAQLDKDLFTLENYLYQTYYEKLAATRLKYNQRDERVFLGYQRKYVDMLNARILIKLAKESGTKQQLLFKDLFLAGGKISQATLNGFSGLGRAELQQKLSALIAKTYGTHEEISAFDETINAHKRKSGAFLSSIRFGSPFFSLKFLFAVEKEISYLRVLLKAKYLGMDKKAIQVLFTE